MSTHQAAAGTQVRAGGRRKYDRRRGHFVSSRAQGRFRAQILGLAFLVSLVSLGLTRATAYLVKHENLLEGQLVPAGLALATVLLCAVIVRLCDRISHRVAGPAHRLGSALEAVQRGEHVAPITLRTGDQLQDLAETLNATLQQLGAMQPPPGAIQPPPGSAGDDA
jgi:hypothetical protein